MIQPGTIQQGLALAKARWEQMFPFDLAEETWAQVAYDFRPGEILQAIRLMRDTRDTRREMVYARFVRTLDSIAAQRR